MDSVKLIVQPRGKPIRSLPDSVEIALSSTGAQLHDILAQKTKLSVHRLRIIKGSDSSVVANKTDNTIAETGLRNGSAILVKDLGPQIAWRTVFLIEYIGPILIHPLIYFLRPYIYFSDAPPASAAQQLALVLCVLHFVKRELETLFVHRFSLATMPARNIFKNSFHYWVLSGVNLAYWIYSPHATKVTQNLSPAYLYALTAVWVFSELSNLSTHLTLKNLRPAGSTTRAIPQGYGFSAVTCPNYGFEILGWIAVALITLNWSAVFFVIASTGQMYLWAKKKEKRYRSEFGDKYKKKRAVIFPYIL